MPWSSTSNKIISAKWTTETIVNSNMILKYSKLFVSVKTSANHKICFLIFFWRVICLIKNNSKLWQKKFLMILMNCINRQNKNKISKKDMISWWNLNSFLMVRFKTCKNLGIMLWKNFLKILTLKKHRVFKLLHLQM